MAGVSGLYAILDTDALAKRNCPLPTAAQAMLAGGASLLQIRHKGYWSRAAFEEAESIAEACRGHNARLIINDRADLALLLEAGVHVGQDDLFPRLARPPFVGLSTHNPEQIEAAAREPVDYVAIGPIFGTLNKLNPSPVVGVDRFREWRQLTAHPVVAIGGITRHNARAVLEAGADAVAVIGDLLPEVCTAAALQARTEEWLRVVSAF
jgi:thiamine-phosphate pyrophosphorylase